MSQFMSQSMTREAALRIGLAARELEMPRVTELVLALADRIGLPLTETKLNGITVTDLREVLVGEVADEHCRVGVEPEKLKRAVRLLWGEGVVGSDLPPLDAFSGLSAMCNDTFSIEIFSMTHSALPYTRIPDSLLHVML